jgi:hypothetical protein
VLEAQLAGAQQDSRVMRSSSLVEALQQGGFGPHAPAIDTTGRIIATASTTRMAAAFRISGLGNRAGPGSIPVAEGFPGRVGTACGGPVAGGDVALETGGSRRATRDRTGAAGPYGDRTGAAVPASATQTAAIARSRRARASAATSFITASSPATATIVSGSIALTTVFPSFSYTTTLHGSRSPISGFACSAL